MSWRKVTCAERDEIFYAERHEKLRPLSSCTDMAGEFHGGDPQMDITWGLYSDATPETPVLRETRYPSRESGQPDRKPCEHYVFEPDEVSVPAADVLVCPAEDSGRCDLAETEFHPPERRTHVCDFDENHGGAHECACGHTWTNNEEN